MSTLPYNPPTGLHQVFHLAEIRSENYRSKTFIFKEALACQPGQFVMAWLPGIGEKPFSIAASDPLTLMIVSVGPVSEAIHHMVPGERMWIRGPLGQGYHLQGDKALLVGGGYGVAPLLYLARTARLQNMAVEICIGARTAADVLLVPAFEQIGAQVNITTEDGSLGQQGLVTSAVSEAVHLRRPDALYACGPGRMLEALETLCLDASLPCQLSWEAHMRCGIGLCGSCELPAGEGAARKAHGPGWLTCMDGPVSHSP